jgi:replication factor A2
LKPLTIKQCINAVQAHADAPILVDNDELSQFTLVGHIVKVTEQSTNVTYLTDDGRWWFLISGTGLIDVKYWLDENDTDYNAQKRAALREGIYVKVTGQLRNFGNKRNVVAFNIRPIQDFNEVILHYLECIQVHLYYTQGMSCPKATINNNNAQQSFVQQQSIGGITNGQHFSPIQQKILYIAQMDDRPEGFNIPEVSRRLNAECGVGHNEVMEAIDFLISEGHLYSTVDDNHVKGTHSKSAYMWLNFIL